MGRWVTFDCYGTLVDWNAGIAAALGEALLERYHEIEPVVQAEDPTLSYRDVMRETARRIGVDTDPAATLPEWPVFGDVRRELVEARRRGWTLGILTNSDRDLIEASIRSLDVPFELAIVASEIGSYKPAYRHWEAFRDSTGRLPDVHVAQSHFHDIAPASELGIPTVWINRLGETAEPPPTRELPGLNGLVDVLDELASSSPAPQTTSSTIPRSAGGSSPSS